MKRLSWTKKEIGVVVSLYREGCSFLDIAEKLPWRSVVAIKHKIIQLIKRGKLAERKKETPGISYKKVLAETDWPKMQHFLGELSYYAGLVQNQNKEPNIAKFIETYVEIFSLQKKS